MAYTVMCVEGIKPPSERWAPLLNDEGHHVLVARSRKTALAKAQDGHPALILVDAPSLRLDAGRLCSGLRAADFGIPLLMLLPPEASPDAAADADSFLSHPVTAAALVERVSALLAPILQVGEVVLNVERRALAYCNTRQRLTPKQCRLLEVLMRHPGQVLSRAFLMKQVWDTDYLGDTRTLDVHMHTLRQLVEKEPRTPLCLCTVRGVGYCFAAPPEK